VLGVGGISMVFLEFEVSGLGTVEGSFSCILNLRAGMWWFKQKLFVM
jgi:hypothetical protein